MCVYVVFMSWETQPRAACMPHGQHTTLTACNDIFWQLVLNTIFLFAMLQNKGNPPCGRTPTVIATLYNVASFLSNEIGVEH